MAFKNHLLFFLKFFLEIDLFYSFWSCLFLSFWNKVKAIMNHENNASNHCVVSEELKTFNNNKLTLIILVLNWIILTIVRLEDGLRI